MTIIPPQQLVPVFAPGVSLESLDTHVSHEQIQLLIRLDETSSVSVLASLLALPLADCIVELKTLTARGLLVLRHRRPHSTKIEQTFTWQESMAVLEELQDSLSGSRESLSRTLTDVFATPSKEMPSAPVSSPSVSVPTIPTARSIPTSRKPHEVAPTLTETPAIRYQDPGTTAEAPSLFGTRPYSSSDDENSSPRHHTLDSAADLPALTPEMLEEIRGWDTNGTQPELPNLKSVTSYDSFDHRRGKVSYLSVPKRFPPPQKPAPRQERDSQDSIEHADSVQSSSSWDELELSSASESCESTDPNIPPFPLNNGSNSKKT
ncbi:MAG: hypothetical protein EP343_00760 [Deltaproteobacteria bacterium]|nr:MAG: hypothetical protein EP343_00760 [Deltaproteobacteria bacterium]